MFVSIFLLAVLSADGGADAGIADAGGLSDAGPVRWKWIDGDGGWLLDGGVTDILTLRVDETARIIFPLPIVLMQCDEPLLGLGATEDTLLLTGVKTGHTACGFWFDKRAWPHRTFDVTVSK